MVGDRLKERATLAGALALTIAYVLVSAQVLFWVSLDVCDEAEQACTTSWDGARIGRWVAWIGVGLVVALLFRHAVRTTRRHGLSVNQVSWAGGIGIAAGLVLAAAAWFGQFPV
jgi:hypothetical protein